MLLFIRVEATLQPSFYVKADKTAYTIGERTDVFMNSYTSARGTIAVHITHMEGRLLLAGATVEVLNRGERYITDKNGTVRIVLPAPPKALSLQPNPPARPYAVYDLRISMSGYAPVTIYGVHVFDGIVSIFNYNLIRLDDTDVPEGERINVPLHRRYSLPPYDSTPNTAAFAATQEEVRTVSVPETVTVHLGTPGSDAVNVTVPFVNYIKSVASSEVYPTWPRESILANIHAQVSLILNRLYTEWYPSQGYDFDVSSSPAFDQFYVYQREVFNTIDALVDEYFDNYIARSGFIEPIFAQFCDGKETICGGLSQWGTVDLANNGYNAAEIVKYYYGKDMEIRQAPIVQVIPDSYPGEPLALGSSGDVVLALQNRIDRIAINYPAIPFITLPNGQYDAETERAVRTFQQVFGLSATGIVDEDTWYKILYIYVAVKKLAELESEGEEVESGAYPGNDVKLGDRGPNVLRIQWYINAIARSNQYPQVPVIELDGIFDAETENAVRIVQGLFGFRQSGVVDRQTWDSLTALYNEVGELGTDDQYPDNPVSGWPRPYPGTAVKRGDRGDNVYYIQELLGVISKYQSAVPTVEKDGIFGAETQASIRAFQTANGLTADGIVGPLTWEKLNAIYGDAEQSLPSQG